MGQHIRGTVSNAFTEQPVQDAVISFLDGQLNVQSDRNGQFAITGLGPGRYVLRVQHIAYHGRDVEILLTSSKDVVLGIDLEPRSIPLAEVTVPGRAVVVPHRLYRITPEEVRRYPGTFFDPARFAGSFPGVQVANDQANQLIIHGLHPDLMQWRLEGMEIVNPNHLSNAGTLGDRTTATGGGVHMISNLMLSSATLSTGAFDLSHGNAISGVMNMSLQSGNTAKAEHTAQLGLLGIDLATGGPFVQGGLSSYAVNARYSTVGLLTDLGVDFGDEMINFADATFSTQFQLSEHGSRLKVFGFGGYNTNDLQPKEPAEREEDRDRSDIAFSSSTGALGILWTHPVSARVFLKAGTVWSGTEHDRTESRIAETGPEDYANEEGAVSKWSSMVSVSIAVSSKTRLKAGMDATRHAFNLDGYSAFGGYAFTGDMSSWHARPYLAATFSFGRLIELEAGAGFSSYSYYTPNALESGNPWLEPRISVRLKPHPAHHLSATVRGSTQPLYEYAFLHMPGATPNTFLSPVKAGVAQLKYQYAFPVSILEGELFYYELYDLPILPDSDFSVLNLQDLPNNRNNLVSAGEGRTYGATLGYRRNFSHSWFVSANAGIYRSIYDDYFGEERGTTFDAHHSLYLIGGKEWGSEKAYGQRTFGINASLIERGGLRQPVIDEAESQVAQRTIYVAGTAGDSRIDGYFRMDMRLYLRKDKASHSSTWSLDIQNVFNVENDWLPAYDFFQGGIRRNTQLGVIPILNYRIDF
ncbi:MAG: TonB-dependent receptor [Saprospiraceae bacterium]|nr:TonB-dependent receptor [Saprospiraceae bacterium]